MTISQIRTLSILLQKAFFDCSNRILFSPDNPAIYAYIYKLSLKTYSLFFNNRQQQNMDCNYML